MRDGRPSTAPPVGAPEPQLVAEMSEAQISSALARGDARAALLLCAELYGASVGRLCMALLGSQAAADEVTERSLLLAYDSFREFRGQSTVRAWLLGLARRECLQRLEQERRQAKRRGARASGALPLTSTSRLVLRASRARALLERVRPSERDALVLRYAADASAAEVASICGVGEAAMHERLSDALVRLDGMLDSEVGDE